MKSEKGKGAKGKGARKGGQPKSKQPRPVKAEEAIRAGVARLRTEFVTGGSDLAPLVAARPGREHVVLDLDGRPLFYDVELVEGEGPVGALRVAASETVGSALVSVEEGPRRWDPDAALEGATKAAGKLHPKARVMGAELVCYCYPKIGVRITLEREGGERQALLLDASDLLPVNRFGVGEPEGLMAYSYYAEVVDPTLESRERRYAREQEQQEALRKIAPELFEQEFRFTDQTLKRIRDTVYRASPYTIDQLVFGLTQQRVLPYGPRCGAGEDLHLYAQQTNVFCAVATGQMILDWHRWNYTQDEIAAAMSTGPGGTTNPNQVAGYEALTNNSFVATYDTSAQWSEAKAEIDGGRPLKSGIPGHARACNGYRRTFNFFAFAFDRAIRVYDPWPWNADICNGGAVYWEDWEAVTHTNWIYVRHA